MERTVTVVPEDGLHARPASQVVEAASEYESRVTVGPAGGESVDASSMLAVTSLGVGSGDAVDLTADGEDEQAALDELETILTTPES
ncbi:HPr family phosphocarrier protein [Halohasta litorea]|uniref:HPr family phosphocarrier protein n=1 Tax=Halohasta litorea TaxID=869891 RepID=A0ABD6D802_9EURY|nr:HPr family phosphocarrier protein [Halohasta litorea]MEA1930547.1 HPr family phosphocarrier protein [Euryarchaeota archaeon]